MFASPHLNKYGWRGELLDFHTNSSLNVMESCLEEYNFCVFNRAFEFLQRVYGFKLPTEAWVQYMCSRVTQSNMNVLEWTSGLNLKLFSKVRNVYDKKVYY